MRKGTVKKKRHQKDKTKLHLKKMISIAGAGKEKDQVETSI